MDATLAGETLLILAERPGDAASGCGAAIASLCRAGRPPFVVVLTDGPAPGEAADAAVQRELAGLGMPGGRMLMFGIAGAAPAAGAIFSAAVQAVCFVAWRHDCNVVVAPRAGPAAAMARSAVAASGLGLAEFGAGAVRLVARPRRSAREA